MNVLLSSFHFFFTDSVAQFTLIQEPRITTSLGGSVRLYCRRSAGSVVGGNWPLWVYQAPGSVPKYVSGSNGGSNHNVKPAGISDRFTGSISAGISVLDIHNIQTADDGNYYCTLWAGSARTVLQNHMQWDINIKFLFVSHTYFLINHLLS
ncbi:unnamed protein product [Staurois parvus]|uniref:Ig-like domain-containing protein n=1 Tax=Staurois parvus TaxID=386267 RepID=A0ABN9C4C5_9NEOB|nr:unnamed protein product [Staurois parvus]